MTYAFTHMGSGPLGWDLDLEAEILPQDWDLKGGAEEEEEEKEEKFPLCVKA